MSNYEVEVIFFVKANDEDEAVRLLDTALDTRYRAKTTPFGGQVSGYEILKGAATEVD